MLLGVVVTVGVAVGDAVGVILGVVVGVGVGLALAVAVGVGVGEGPPCAQYLPPLLVTKRDASRNPPHTIISSPVHTAA